ncbi:DUF4041 domain-containing protein [Oculatella sp. LEGE 06141]|uniref:DUF4041 domain-containing protein n=1 Tax=Oculatella sp. LEGE 06141 TaxID=1828648 RepID=UPI0018808F28|nr:DUF4041 domain-containing protein [Oculatella sp. LEGE 06141]MBE9177788.1 DUF4041 domain-containing protein [Oculatella sp. LEGE 06141]
MDVPLLLATLGLIGAGVQLMLMQNKQDRLSRELDQYKRSASKGELDELIRTKEEITKQVNNLRQKLSGLEEEAYVQSFGFYEPKYDFINSEGYAASLKKVKSEQKSMIKKGTAVVSQTKLVFNDSEKKGQKLTDNLRKFILIAFNTETDDVIFKVKHSNIQASKERIVRSYKRLNKLAETTTCEITQQYLDLKLTELYLQYEMACKKQQEKEQEQERRKDDNERKVLAKAEEEIRKSEQKEEIYRQRIEEVRQAIEQVEGEKRRQLELENNRLQQELEKAQTETEQATSRYRARKAGYIYVISNIGSLGQDIYRICKSVRQDDYISEMNPALPFPFDIHFKIFSEDSSDTLKRLHSRFQDRRVNLLNDRREFFKVSISEIAQAIDEINQQTGVLNILKSERVAQAYEYRRTVFEQNKTLGSNRTDAGSNNATA